MVDGVQGEVAMEIPKKAANEKLPCAVSEETLQEGVQVCLFVGSSAPKSEEGMRSCTRQTK